MRRWKGDTFCRLIYQFTVNKILILKYQSGRKFELTNDMMKQAGEGVAEIHRVNPVIFYVQYEHMMEQFWTDRLPADS